MDVSSDEFFVAILSSLRRCHLRRPPTVVAEAQTAALTARI